MIIQTAAMQKDNSTKTMKMMKHDIRSPLSCLMMCSNFSLGLRNADKESLLNFTEQLLKILDSATDPDLFIRDMTITLDLCKSYFNQAPLILSYDKETILRYIDRMARTLISPARQLKSSSLKNNEINIITSINNILLEKKLEHLNSNFKFFFTKSEDIENLFISGSIDDFERMLSNLLNNAAEACSDVAGAVLIHLDVTDKLIYLIIEDNGKGIPSDVLQQLRNGISITSGKENGQGIGIVQIRGAISRLNGQLTIRSDVGHGSKFIIAINRSF